MSWVVSSVYLSCNKINWRVTQKLTFIKKTAGVNYYNNESLILIKSSSFKHSVLAWARIVLGETASLAFTDDFNAEGSNKVKAQTSQMH